MVVWEFCCDGAGGSRFCQYLVPAILPDRAADSTLRRSILSIETQIVETLLWYKSIGCREPKADNYTKAPHTVAIRTLCESKPSYLSLYYVCIRPVKALVHAIRAEMWANASEPHRKEREAVRTTWEDI